MRIGVNARLLLENRLEGIGWHAFEIISRMIQNHPRHEFILYYDRRRGILIPSGKNIRPVVIYPPSRHPLLIWWWCKALARKSRQDKPDVFYSPEVLMPLGLNIPVLVTIHDLSPLVMPDSLPRVHSFFYRHLIPRNALAADHIITVSQFSRSEIQHSLQIPPEKISVVYNAARSAFHPINPEEKQKIRNQYTRGKPYFIYLGAIHERKNVDQIVKAFDLFSKQSGTSHFLILAGKFMGRYNKARQAIRDSPYASHILQTGYIEDGRAAALLAAASAMINMSSYEGFGMPLVEAFQSGTPVIASSASCYPEITGEDAILVEPGHVNSIVDAMNLSLSSSGEYSDRGIERAKKFDWAISSQQVWHRLHIMSSGKENFILSSP